MYRPFSRCILSSVVLRSMQFAHDMSLTSIAFIAADDML